MDAFYGALIGLIFGSIGGSFVSFYFFKKQNRWVALREAGMLALEVVDSVYSNNLWTDQRTGNPIKIAPQPIDIALARKALNHLSLTCKNPHVITYFFNAIGLQSADGKSSQIPGDAIFDLRNAIRVELGFGKPLQLDRNKSFIGHL